MVAIGMLLLLGINATTYTAFALDKAKARNRRRRIRESTLLWLAALGGTPAAYAARATFRHKTHKQPFSTHLGTIAAAQFIALALGLGWFAFG